MKLGNGWLKLDVHGNTVPLVGVTPAEVVVLASLHAHNAKGENPVTEVKDASEVKCDDADEIQRLNRKYPSSEVVRLFPQGTKLPIDFAEAMKVATDLIKSGRYAHAAKQKA